MVTDRLPWSERLAVWLRTAVEARLPLLGICYGHQLPAHALGGRADYHPQGREIGTVAVRLPPAGHTDPLLGDLPGEFPAHVTHAQTALRLPPNARLLAGNDFEPHHAFAVGPCAWGVQFHPEFDAEITRCYIREQEESLRREGADVDALLASVRPAPASEGLLHRFALLL